MIDNIKAFLDSKVIQYNRPDFIPNDPVCIPHLFTKKQDIEVMGLWASVLAWGQRITIINKCRELISLMDGAPYDFIMNHEPVDLKKLLAFKHRTFNDIDTLYFITFFRHHYSHHDSLETAFLSSTTPTSIVIPGDSERSSEGDITAGNKNAGCHAEALEARAQRPDHPHVIKDTANGLVENALNNFRSYFISLPDFPNRTKKHISSPSQNSTCKRLNMFLRWMVRKDNCGVDFGIWHNISPADLIVPCDLHVDRVSRKLGLITRKQTDWHTAMELTERLREFDPLDPVKYDFALFGLGIEEKF